MSAGRFGDAAVRAYIGYRVALALVALLSLAWVVTHYRWVEEEVDDVPRGAAVDPAYALRQVLQAVGATVETHTSLEPMPPADATLVIASSLWSVFPERDARLKAWVENGGHLVVQERFRYGDDTLRWVPLSFALPRPDPAASAAEAAAEAGFNDTPAASSPANAHEPVPPAGNCAELHETAATTEPAFVPGQLYRACSLVGTLRPHSHVGPIWQLSGRDGTLAMRVPIGRGSVTGVAPRLVLDNLGLRRGDNARIAAAVLQATPGRVVWILGAESREPLASWLWHEARTPTLLAALAVVLGLWRLMVRFGPREAVPPQARRSMGEQVRGTGRFVASLDPRALHAATRIAFDDAARKRVADWGALADDERVRALATAVAHFLAIDQPALLVSLNVGGGATPAQVLAATTVLEQARRALLRTPPSAS